MSILLAIWLGLFHGAQEPLRLAIQPLTPRSVDKDDAEMIADVLAAKLMESGKFRVMERSEMSRILSEQGFQKSGACEGQKCAVEVGRILGIEQMVVGAFGKLGESWVLTVRRVDVETGEVVGQSIRQFEGALKDVPQALVAVVAADLVGGQIEPVAEKIAPTKSIAVPKYSGKVRVRIRPDSGATATWIWLEEGQSKRKLGEAPIDTILELRHKVFLSAAEPGWSSPTRQYWLVGPEDERDTAWKFVAAKFGASNRSGVGSPSGLAASNDSKSEGAVWKMYGQERKDAEAKREGGVLLRGLGWTTFATSVVVGIVAYSMATDTNGAGQYTRSQESRQDLGLTTAACFATGALGMIMAFMGSNIVADADKQLGSGPLELAPVAGLGVAGEARGLSLSLAF